jgi:peptide-methionine (R)-S-oxide reductase
MAKMEKTDAQWKEALTPEQFRVLRERGTERPFTGEYCEWKQPALFVCAGCGQELFRSEAKYDSGSGWPSFYEPAASGSVDTHDDRTQGMARTEVTCSRCGGHLGHVFEDGPRPTGLRYCINSAALKALPPKK